MSGDEATAGAPALDEPPAPEAWDAQPIRIGEDEDEALLVDIDGFSGPLDVLLALARTQKVDLTQISVVALADQYLAFVAEARRLRLALAGDYLVMAAWLAFLKSRLILPSDETQDGELSG
ncbi:MAG: ScpA family protein, partial [Pseudomonadota bacterium]